MSRLRAHTRVISARARPARFFSYTYIYIYKFARDNNTDMPDRGPRFNLFTARVCRTDYATFSLPLSFSLTLALSFSLPLFRLTYKNGDSYVKLH